jgi:hypothetical protein
MRPAFCQRDRPMYEPDVLKHKDDWHFFEYLTLGQKYELPIDPLRLNPFLLSGLSVRRWMRQMG